MLESQIQSKLIATLHAHGWFVCKLNLCSIGGMPDLFCAHSGTIVLIECKATGKHPRKLQDLCHAKLRSHGVPVVVYDGTKDIFSLIQAETNKTINT